MAEKKNPKKQKTKKKNLKNKKTKTKTKKQKQNKNKPKNPKKPQKTTKEMLRFLSVLIKLQSGDSDISKVSISKCQRNKLMTKPNAIKIFLIVEF